MNGPALSPAVCGLIRSIINLCELPKARTLLRQCQMEPWKSLTFTGERHTFALVVPASAADRLQSELPDAELSGDGFIVADISVIGVEPQPEDRALVRIEALTVDDQ